MTKIPPLRSQCPRGLRRSSAAARFLDCGFDSHQGHGCLSFMWVLCLVR